MTEEDRAGALWEDNCYQIVLGIYHKDVSSNL